MKTKIYVLIAFILVALALGVAFHTTDRNANPFTNPFAIGDRAESNFRLAIFAFARMRTKCNDGSCECWQEKAKANEFVAVFALDYLDHCKDSTPLLAEMARAWVNVSKLESKSWKKWKCRPFAEGFEAETKGAEFLEFVQDTTQLNKARGELIDKFTEWEKTKKETSIAPGI